jgi:hypothetical protein
MDQVKADVLMLGNRGMGALKRQPIHLNSHCVFG